MNHSTAATPAAGRVATPRERRRLILLPAATFPFLLGGGLAVTLVLGAWGLGMAGAVGGHAGGVRATWPLATVTLLAAWTAFAVMLRREKQYVSASDQRTADEDGLLRRTRL